MIDLTILFSLFTLGLVSSAHCIGMCGGIMGALTMAIPAEARAQRWLIVFSYNLGRILSYGIMGLLAGLVAGKIAAFGGGVALRVIAGLLLLAMGLYLANWWQGLTRLEALGRYLWAYLQPVGKKLMPVDSVIKALLLGCVWGWLPCGLVYTALSLSMTQPAPLQAAAAMLAFGLGTLPALLAAGIFANHLRALLQQPGLRVGLALIIIMFGVWTIWGALGHAAGHDHSAQGAANSAQMDHSQMNHSAIDHSKLHESEPAAAQDEGSAQGFERQRTDAEVKMEEHQNSARSSVAGAHSHH